MSRQVKLTRAVATYPLSVVAFLMGIGRNAAYDAATDEVFPTIRECVRPIACQESRFQQSRFPTAT